MQELYEIRFCFCRLLLLLLLFYLIDCKSRQVKWAHQLHLPTVALLPSTQTYITETLFHIVNTSISILILF